MHRTIKRNNLTFGKNLKSFREKHGLTQFQLSAKSGVSLVTIVHLEKGHLQNPRLATLEKLSKTMGTTIDQLVYSNNVAA